MLVLSRKQGQSIELAEIGVVVRVVKVKGSRVQLGIEAPAEITICRPEKHLDSDPAPAANSIRSETGPERDEFSRLEAELASLAELADPKDQAIARQIAADSIRRLEGIRRSLRVRNGRQPSEVRPIGELVRVRTEVLEQLRSKHNTQQPTPTWSETDTNRLDSVRQPSSPYAVRQSEFAAAANVA